MLVDYNFVSAFCWPINCISPAGLSLLQLGSFSLVIATHSLDSHWRKVSSTPPPNRLVFVYSIQNSLLSDGRHQLAVVVYFNGRNSQKYPPTLFFSLYTTTTSLSSAHKTNPNFERTSPHLLIQHLLKIVSIGFVSPPNTTTADIVTITIVTIIVIVAIVVAVNIIAIAVQYSTINVKDLHLIFFRVGRLPSILRCEPSPTSGTTTKKPLSNLSAVQ